MLVDILNRVGDTIVLRLKNRLDAKGLTATGETKDSIKKVVTANGLQITANASIMTLVKGRKRTENNGTGVVRAKIKEWARAKGIPLNAVGAIVKKIHEKGIQVPNKYNDGKLFEEVFNEELDNYVKKELFGFIVNNK